MSDGLDVHQTLEQCVNLMASGENGAAAAVLDGHALDATTVILWAAPELFAAYLTQRDWERAGVVVRLALAARDREQESA